MQGLWIEGRRPPSKKAVREAIAEGREVYVEATSFFGNEYGGSVYACPENEPILFVGPDPHTKRNFYGQIVRKGVKVVVK